jgi:hypothetical protein
MKKTTMFVLTVIVAAALTLPAWSIEREKKGSGTKESKRTQVTKPTERESKSPVEIAPPKQPKTQEPRQERPKVEQRPSNEQVAREKKVRLPEKRKVIEKVDQFIDKNGNGIDDRLESRKKKPQRGNDTNKIKE